VENRPKELGRRVLVLDAISDCEIEEMAGAEIPSVHR